MAIWKSIKGYDNAYWVSDEGQVMSLKNKGKLLKPYLANNGYYMIDLCKNGKRYTYLLHRLVAEAFLPNPDNLPCVNHKNEIKTDNRAEENLEWCTYLYNNTYGSRNTRLNYKIQQFDLQMNFLSDWSSFKEIENTLGFSSSNVCFCCKGKYKQAYGFIWKYAA